MNCIFYLSAFFHQLYSCLRRHFAPIPCIFNISNSTSFSLYSNFNWSISEKFSYSFYARYCSPPVGGNVKFSPFYHHLKPCFAPVSFLMFNSSITCFVVSCSFSFLRLFDALYRQNKPRLLHNTSIGIWCVSSNRERCLLILGQSRIAKALVICTSFIHEFPFYSLWWIALVNRHR